MKKEISLLLFFIFLKGTAQYKERESIIEDFNKDGVKDTLRYNYNHEGHTITNIINGKTNESLQNDYFYYFGETVFLNSLSPNFFQKENKYFLKTLKKHWFSNDERKENDASLHWILNSIKSKKELPDNDNPYFNLIINPKSKWSLDKIELPNAYYRSLSKKEVFDIYGNEITKKINTEYQSKKHKNHLEKFFNTSNYFLSYIPSLLDGEIIQPTGFKSTIKSNTYKIHKIKHAVSVKKGKESKWLFITNLITGAPQKLRWASIGKIQIVDTYVILEHQSPLSGENAIYIINIETGICGKLKLISRVYESTFNQEENGAFFIKNKELTFLSTTSEKPLTLKLSLLFTELDKQYLIYNN